MALILSVCKDIRVQIRSFFWSEYRKIRIRKTPYLDTFHAVQLLISENSKEAERTVVFYCRHQHADSHVSICLLVYDLDIILPFNNTFTDSTQQKILPARNAALLNKIYTTGSATVLPSRPLEYKCLGTTKGP